jgi:beta-lactamase regulating signal transducer with metallopeptidase domain
MNASLTSLALPVADFAAKGTVVLILAALAALVLRRAAASTRHLVWQAALAGALAMPVLSLLLPQWTIPVFTADARIALPAAAPARGPEAPGLAATGVPGTTRRGVATGESVVAAPAPVAATSLPSVAPTAPAAPNAAMPDLSATTWATRLVLAWLVGVLLVLVTLAAGLARAFVIAGTAREVRDGRLAELARALAGRMGIRRHVRLLARDGAMPMTWGVLRPVILLPDAAVTWPEGRQRDVLLHELAHIARHDHATRLVAWLTCALHWFNPLAWHAAARLRAEQELACDDQVLAAGSRASDYAACLLEIARSLRAPVALAGATVAMARPSQLAGRLLAVLESGRARRAARGRTMTMVWSLATLVVVPLAAAAPGVRVRTTDRPLSVGPDAGPLTGARRTAPRPEGTRKDPLATGGTPVDDVGEARLTLVRSDSATPVPALDVASQGGCVWDATHDVSVSSHSRSSDGSIAEANLGLRIGPCRLEIRMLGVVTFNDDETEVAAIGAGGSFIMEETGSGEDRRLEVRLAGGGLERRWFVNGRRSDNEAEARAWMAERLPIVLRRTGYGAEARAMRILARGGVDGLLRAATDLSGDYAKRIYYMVLVDSARLDPDQLRRVTRQAGQEIESDYELAELLIHVAQRYTLDAPVRAIFIEAAGTIQSDYERRRVLSTALARERLSDDVAVALLRSASLITSDYETGELLIQFAQTNPLSERVRPAFFVAVGTLGSDYEHHRVLAAVVERSGSNRAVLQDVLESAVRIGSDYEKAELLVLVASGYPLGDGELRSAYLRAADTVHSEYDRGRVMAAFARRQS